MLSERQSRGRRQKSRGRETESRGRETESRGRRQKSRKSPKAIRTGTQICRKNKQKEIGVSIDKDPTENNTKKVNNAI